jgi:hypothetical protein
MAGCISWLIPSLHFILYRDLSSLRLWTCTRRGRAADTRRATCQLPLRLYGGGEEVRAS